MANHNRQPFFIRPFLKGFFPQTVAPAVTTASVCHDQYFFGTGIQSFPQFLPPALNTSDGKLCRIIIGPHINPSQIMGNIVSSVGRYFSKLFIYKIIRFYFQRMICFMPLASRICKIPYQLLFLCIYRDCGAAPTLEFFHCCCNILKLQISIWILPAFESFSVAL